MVTLDDSGALDLGKIMKKVKQLLVPKGRADKQFGLQILRMMQRGVVDVLVDVRAHVSCVLCLPFLVSCPIGLDSAAGDFFASSSGVTGHCAKWIGACVWPILS